VKLITAALSALFLLIVSTVLRSAELHFMSAALISVPVISYILGRVTVRRLQCRREAPEYVSEGERFCVSLELWGKSRLLGPIEIDDALPEWVERDEDARSRVSQQGPDRIVASYTAAATKRGEYAIGPLRLHISDPLGFFQFACTYSLTSRLVVLPSPLQVPNLHVQAAGSFGEHQFEGSGARGGGTDFDGVREYHQGDELRRVNWPSTARHGRLNVIEFEHAKAEDTVVALDLERGSEIGTGKHSSLEYAVKIGAGLVEQALNLGSMVRLACAGIHGPAAAYGRGLDHLYAVLDALARVQANQTREAVLRAVPRSADFQPQHGGRLPVFLYRSGAASMYSPSCLEARDGRLHPADILGRNTDRDGADGGAIGGSRGIPCCRRMLDFQHRG
jgi:uncharacterized protein (DUF58 family)